MWLRAGSCLSGPVSLEVFKIPSSSVVLKYKVLEASEEAAGQEQRVLEAGSGR